MQMSSVRVVSLWAKHRGKYFAAAVMRETQELGFGCEGRTHTGAVFEAGAAETFTTSVTAPFVFVFFWESEAVFPKAAFFAFSAATRSRSVGPQSCVKSTFLPSARTNVGRSIALAKACWLRWPSSRL